MHNNERSRSYDPAYDRMDRRELLAHFERFGRDFFTGDRMPSTRRELINALIDAEKEKLRRFPTAPDSYPLSRPSEPWDQDEEFTRESAQRVFLSWETDPLAAVTALVTDSEDYRWNIPDGLQPGDVVVTVLGARMPLVVQLEVVTTIENRLLDAEKISVFSNPVPFDDLGKLARLSLRHEAQELDATDADQFIAALTELAKNPRPIFLAAGDCLVDDANGTNTMLGAISLLQAGREDDVYCAACDRVAPETLHPHILRPNPELLELEIQDHVDDTVLLCEDCHAVLHRPTLRQLRGVLASPPCPDCGERNPRGIIWGMPAGQPDDDHVAYGCVLPLEDGPLPKWECRKCERTFGVHPMSQ